MNKTLAKGFGIGILLVVLSILGMYLGLAYYYKDGFSYNTWINGVYCTGKSLNEVNKELQEDSAYQGLTITDCDGKSYTILSDEVSLTMDYLPTLEVFRKKQNPLLWIDNMLGKGKNHEVMPVVSYKETVLNEKIDELPFFTGIRPEDRKVEIVKGSQGYELLDERSHVLNEDKTREYIRKAFDSFQEVLDLEEAGCYEDLPLTDQMQEDILLSEKLSSFQECGVVYVFGNDEVKIDGSITCDFMKKDENGNFLFDENGNLIPDRDSTDAFIYRLADEYDTVGTTREFMATRGEKVLVEGGIYGNKMDRDAEKEYLFGAFCDKRTERHEPEYLQKALYQGKDDIGPTYIEVDMSEQKMYYYENGVLKLETDVVTGNTSLHRGTPSGTNYVYNKQRNRVLRGADYATPVKYWIPVYKAIGIHDASWRKNFGGEIYKTNGSHGCVNTPTDQVSQLYDMVEIGTPCVMFY